MNDVRLDTILHDTLTTIPALIVDFDIIRHTYDRFAAAFPNAHIDYAMKANANPIVLRAIAQMGGGMEIASLAELKLTLEAGVPAERIICSNPIKNPIFLMRLHEQGVYAMVVDSVDEVEKVAQYAPGSRIYVRLSVDNTGSVLPLAGKFGVDAQTAIELFDQARELGLQPMGLSFHVGSQCLNPQNWVNAIQACGEAWQMATAHGHHLYFLDIGGGFPAGHYHTTTIPTIEAIGAAVMDAVKTYIPPSDDFMLILEPGRGLVGEAGRLVTTVVGKAQRVGKTWLYMDAGVFNGLMETYEGFPPVVRPLRDCLGEGETRENTVYTLAGPSCDSCDVVARDITLPTMKIGERLVFFDTGAYTNEYAAAFNGFPIPQFIPINLDGAETSSFVADTMALKVN
ncbi:MAG: type III PLP-dependent enzyme [Chloroflexota bacterium]|nr:type III PLP-dependent enzyme [Chloroflexota bacterium]